MSAYKFDIQIISECCPEIMLTYDGANTQLKSLHTKRLGKYTIKDSFDTSSKESRRQWYHRDGAKLEYIVFSNTRNSWEVLNNYANVNYFFGLQIIR